MFGLGIGELIVIGVVVFLFLGPKKIPQLARGVGEAIHEFKNAGKKSLTENKKDNEV